MKLETKQSYQLRIDKVLDYIQTHLDEDIGLDILSSIACFSPYHFHRIFRGMVGETLGEHIRRLRLERAAIELVQTSRRVTDIAFDAQYETVESFCRAFCNRFSIGPGAYRKEWNKQNIDKFELFQTKIKKGDMIMIDVEIVKTRPKKVAYVRHVGPYAKCENAWNVLCSWAGPKGLLGPNTEFLGLCYDDPEVTPADKIRYDACITIDNDISVEGDIKIQEVPGGEYAIAMHNGPYDNLKDTYAQLCGEWLPSSGREMKHAPSIELYLNDPKQTKPAELKTQIQMPLK